MPRLDEETLNKIRIELDLVFPSYTDVVDVEDIIDDIAKVGKKVLEYEGELEERSVFKIYRNISELYPVTPPNLSLSKVIKDMENPSELKIYINNFLIKDIDQNGFLEIYKFNDNGASITFNSNSDKRYILSVDNTNWNSIFPDNPI